MIPLQRWHDNCKIQAGVTDLLGAMLRNMLFCMPGCIQKTCPIPSSISNYVTASCTLSHHCNTAPHRQHLHTVKQGCGVAQFPPKKNLTLWECRMQAVCVSTSSANKSSCIHVYNAARVYHFHWIIGPCKCSNRHLIDPSPTHHHHPPQLLLALQTFLLHLEPLLPSHFHYQPPRL